MTAARVLARFAVTLRGGSVPPAVRERARDLLVDTAGAAIFGATLPWSRIVAAEALAGSAPGPCTVLGARAGAGPRAAALANGTAAHAFELDALRKPGAGVHPGAVLTAAGLAAAQAHGRSGAELITAVVAGCEVMHRIGAATRHSAERRGFHAPGLTGVFGAAITAGRLAGLDERALAHALGIAGSLGSGLLAFAHAERGTMVKRLHLGRAAEGGVLAARLAARGFEGPDTVLEGRHGFLEAYAAERDEAALTAGLGEDWETARICFKRYPCHITAHPPLTALEALRAEARFGPGDVAGIELAVSAKVLANHAARRPADVAAAQYSVPFCLALALHRDPGDPRSLLEGAIDDEAILRDAARIELVPHPPAEARGRAWACRLRLRLRDGRELEREADDFAGTPSRPLTPGERDAKFRRVAGPVLGEATEAVLARLVDVERAGTARELI